MAFCSKCGSEIQSGVAFCPNCGNAVVGSPVGNNNAPKKSKNKIIGLVACLVVLAIVITVVVSIVGKMNSESYEEVAEKYAMAVVKSDYDTVCKYLPYDTEDMVEYSDYDPDYDDDYELVVTTEATRSYEISDYQVEEILNDISEEWSYFGFDIDDYINESKIKEAYQVKVRVSVYEPSDDEDWPPETFTYTVVKYKGKWKVLSDFLSDRDVMFDVW